MINRDKHRNFNIFVELLLIADYGDIISGIYVSRFAPIIVMLSGYSIVSVSIGIVVGEVVNGYKHQWAQRTDVAFTIDETEMFESSTESDELTVTATFKYGHSCGYNEHDLSTNYCSCCGTYLSSINSHSWINNFLLR